ncbi:MAG: family 43 glycosylhydrolase [Kiritimatiellae bacterium]|nr:family 43 glycosylhydrolase [Kiritimatiellia bacterium]
MKNKAAMGYCFGLLAAACACARAEDSAVAAGDVRIRDPFVVADAEAGVYRLYSSIYAKKGEASDGFGNTGKGVEMYAGRDLGTWSRPKTVLELPADMGCTAVWAPEVHAHNGKWHLFATLTFAGTALPKTDSWPRHEKRGTWIFTADRPEGPYRIVKRDSATPPEWSCLDGTLVVEDGKPYMVFCHEWTQVGDGEMCLMPLKDDLSDAAGEPVTLFKASSAPDVAPNCLVTDGPSFCRDPKTGALTMIWSTIRRNGAYCVYQTRSESGRVAGPWKKHELLFGENGGHGMLFRKLGDGALTLALHRPNQPAGAERMAFFGMELEDGRLRIAETAAPAAVPVKPEFRAYRSFLRQFERTADFAAMGVNTRCFFAANTVNSLGTPYCEYPPVWVGPGKYDFAAFDRQADDLLKASPGAEFLVMVDLTMPYWMTRRYCGDAYEHVTDYCMDERWRRDEAAFMKALIGHAEERYGARVKAYVLSGGKTSEWYEFEDGHSSGRKDKAWREWCAKNGKTGHKPYCPPGPTRFDAAFEGVLYDPATQGELLDYWRFHNEIVADAILFFAREARPLVPATKQLGVFFGYYLVDNFRQTSFGHLDYLRVFDSPDLDFVIAPGNYSDRVPGGASGSQSVYGSAFIRGKRLLHEIDCWPHGHPMGWGRYFKTAADDLAGNTREAAFALVNHLSSWWFDMWGGFYDDPALRARIGKLEAIRRRFENDLSPSAAEVLFVCDPDSARYVNEESKTSDELYRHFYNRAVRTGAPVDLYSFDDLPRIDLSRYKVAILAASVNLPPEKAATLRRTLCNAGRTLVFAYAPGISDGKTLDKRRVREWAGVDFGAPGVRVTDRGGWKAAYAADPALYTSAKLAEIYADAGVHRYVDELSPVYANTRVLAVHSATGGVKTIRLRSRVGEVADLLADRSAARDADRFDCAFDTPDTKIFELRP